MQLVRRSKEAFSQQLGRPPEKSPYVSSSLLSTYEQESETCKDWLYQLDWDEEKTLTCATWDMFNLFPKRVKSSIASFVLRASGSWKEEFCTITYYQRPGNTGLKEKKKFQEKWNLPVDRKMPVHMESVNVCKRPTDYHCFCTFYFIFLNLWYLWYLAPYWHVTRS